jgi:hypothetical protein
MKKLFILLLSSFPAALFAQSDAYLDINAVKANINASGDLFYNINTLSPMLEWPQNNISNISMSGSNLWVGATDAGGQLHLTAQTYRQGGTDLWPGPLDTCNVIIDPTISAQWNKVWKINKSTIDSFKLGLFSSIPASIASWPAHGDLAHNQGRNLAPFFDSDGDGMYVPANGDYPVIKGDQAVFFIFNDHLQGGTHVTGTAPFGLEMHGMAYAFRCSASDSSLNNTIFISYKIINRSTYSYLNTYTGTWMDVGLGNYNDDRIGSDSLLNLVYYYDNSSDAIGITQLDAITSSGIGYANNFTAQGNPSNAQEYYNYLQGKWADGTPLTYGSTGYGGSNASNFIFTGDPVVPSGWLDPSSAPSDPRIVGASGPYLMQPGNTIIRNIAYVFAREYSANGIQCVNKLKQQVQSVRSYYTNNSTPCGGSFSGIETASAIRPEVLVYPNPSNGDFYVRIADNIEFDLILFDQLGREMSRMENQRGELHLTTHGLSSGIYYYRIVPKEKYSAVQGKIIFE